MKNCKFKLAARLALLPKFILSQDLKEKAHFKLLCLINSFVRICQNFK